MKSGVKNNTKPAAVVMNMFYTGLGIARSLGEQGVRVIGLSSDRRAYGNATRYAEIEMCPDSRERPEELRDFLLALGKNLATKSVIFPTRDDDVVFLDRFREVLSPYFVPIIPEPPVLKSCLDKWETSLAAKRANVAGPECWMVDTEEDFRRILPQVTYPCVLKPVAAYQWRRAGNWSLVGARKAIGAYSSEQLRSEYATISQASPTVLIQEMIPGGDDCLVIVACYLDAASKCLGWFNTQKLVQSPEGFGTGCIVQAADRPELLERTVRLLAHLRYSGIAEVEYKLDSRTGEYQLIEINPRPWDQHRIGNACGVNLMYLAYCDAAGLPRPQYKTQPNGQKWIAEDTFFRNVLWLMWRRDSRLFSLLKMARGRRIYAIWAASDPAPFVHFVLFSWVPEIATTTVALLSKLFLGVSRTRPSPECHLGKGESGG